MISAALHFAVQVLNANELAYLFNYAVTLKAVATGLLLGIDLCVIVFLVEIVKQRSVLVAVKVEETLRGV